MATYSGHKNWNYWNVSLWIGNDERLYRCAQTAIQSNATRDKAAQDMLHMLGLSGIKETPDGAPYTVSSIRAAMRDM